MASLSVPASRTRRTVLVITAAVLAAAIATAASTASRTSSVVTPKAAAQAAVKAAAGPVRFVSPGGRVNIAPLQGKSVWVVTADASLPFVVSVLNGMKEAGKKAGVSVTVFDGKGSPTTEAAGVQQAVAAKAAAIVLFGINLKNVAGAVKIASDAGVPVVGSLNVDLHDKMEAGAAGEVTIDYYKSGKLLAAYAVAKTNGPVIAAYQNLPAIDTFAAMKRGVQDGLKQYCPTGCKLSVDDLTQANFKTAAQTLTAAQIARNPGLNWIFPFIDGIAGFTIPAVETSGKAKSIRVGSINAVSANLQYIRQGRVQAVDVGNSNAWLGWAMLDRALRAAAKQPAAFSEVPVKLFDKANIAGISLKNEDALFNHVDFRGAYAKLWTGAPS